MEYHLSLPYAGVYGGERTFIYRQQSKRIDLSRRFLQLMIPYILWSLVLFIVHPPYQLKNLLDCILQPDTSFWFLWVLFWIAVLFWAGDWLAERFRLKQEIVIGFVCVILVAVMLIIDVRILGMQFISYYFLFYAMGYFLHKYDDLRTTHPAVLILLTVLWAFLAWFWKMHSAPPFLAGLGLPISFMNYCYRFFTAAVAIYVLLCAAPLLLDYRQGHDNLLIFCGVWSLGIYAVHLLLMPFICNLLAGNLRPAAIVPVAFVLALSVSLLCVFLLTKMKLTRRLLLGKAERTR